MSSFYVQADVETELRTFMKENDVNKMSFTLKNMKHETCLDIDLGLHKDEAIAVASSSKWVTSTLILRLVDQKKLSLDDTTGKILGWKGEKSKITLHQLLNALSNLPAENPCILNPEVPFRWCVNEIYENKTPLTKDAFNYGSSHFHVAARMAEVATGKSWNEIVQTELKAPLKLESETFYYNIPSKRLKGQPLAAGGLVISTSDFFKFLAMIADGGKDYVSSSLIQEQEKRNFNDRTTITWSPFAEQGLSYEYGMGVWRECLRPNCPQSPIVSSMGLFGFYPWLDRANGYYAILSVYHKPSFYRKTYPLMAKMRPELLKISAACRNRK